MARGRLREHKRPEDPLANLHKFVRLRNQLVQNPQIERTPEDYQTIHRRIKDSGPQAPRNAETTIENINRIRRKFIRSNSANLSAKKIRRPYEVTAYSSAHQYLRQFKQLYNRVTGHDMNTDDQKEAYKQQYLDRELAVLFDLRREPKAKPVLGADDVLLLLTHLWARDTSIFPTEHQRLAVAAIMLLSIYTGCRPAELVDASKRKREREGDGRRKQKRKRGDDTSDNTKSLDGSRKRQQREDDVDMSDDAENLDGGDGVDGWSDPDYDRSQL
ncbi:MAG: hypothetical protein M1818_008540 [Claussenomyces sp. TS43310]|nr:MAG: hypothetical protein M1818_008540 [Claussenomyces sp. TS43310]